MPLVELSLKSLEELDDGRVATAFIHELKRVVLDCMDRPGDATARKVNLEFTLKPIIADDGQCESAEGDFKIKSKVPDRKTKTYSFNVNKKGHLIYSSNSPENVDQTTFDDVDPQTGKVSR